MGRITGVCTRSKYKKLQIKSNEQLKEIIGNSNQSNLNKPIRHLARQSKSRYAKRKCVGSHTPIKPVTITINRFDQTEQYSIQDSEPIVETVIENINKPIDQVDSIDRSKSNLDQNTVLYLCFICNDVSSDFSHAIGCLRGILSTCLKKNCNLESLVKYKRTSLPPISSKAKFMCIFCKKQYTDPQKCRDCAHQCMNTTIFKEESNRFYDKTVEKAMELVEVEQNTSILTERDHDDDTYTCLICFGTFAKKDFHIHLYDTCDNRLQCYICQAVFKNTEKLDDHIKKTHDNKLYCLVCREDGFPNLSRLRIHVRTHNTLSAVYFCGDCNAKFNNKTAYDNHRLFIHTRENKKARACADCGHSFNRDCFMNRHLRAKATNNGKCGNFTTNFCHFCNFKAEDLAQAAIHKIQVHDSLNMCSKCGLQPNHLKTLAAHMRFKYGKYHCQKCSTEFNTRAAWYKHLENEHLKCVDCDIIFKIHDNQRHRCEKQLKRKVNKRTDEVIVDDGQKPCCSKSLSESVPITSSDITDKQIRIVGDEQNTEPSDVSVSDIRIESVRSLPPTLTAFNAQDESNQTIPPVPSMILFSECFRTKGIDAFTSINYQCIFCGFKIITPYVYMEHFTSCAKFPSAIMAIQTKCKILWNTENRKNIEPELAITSIINFLESENFYNLQLAPEIQDLALTTAQKDNNDMVMENDTEIAVGGDLFEEEYHISTTYNVENEQKQITSEPDLDEESDVLDDDKNDGDYEVEDEEDDDDDEDLNEYELFENSDNAYDKSTDYDTDESKKNEISSKSNGKQNALPFKKRHFF